MLREALPEIVTGSVPGLKAAELLKRRDAAIPKAMCGTTYPICMGRGEGSESPGGQIFPRHLQCLCT